MGGLPLELDLADNLDTLEIISEFSFEEKGRIDILLKQDHRIYAIENKLIADFRENQLEDYKQGIEKIPGMDCKLYALIPVALDQQVKAEGVTVVFWEDVIARLKNGTNSPPEVWRELSVFVSELIGLSPPQVDWFNETNKLTDSHKQFIDYFAARYLPMLEKTDRGSGRVYTGMYLRRNKEDNCAVCYLSIQIIDSKPVLVVLTPETYDLSQDFDYLCPKEHRPPAWKWYESNNLGSNYKMWKYNHTKGKDWKSVGDRLRNNLLNLKP